MGQLCSTRKLTSEGNIILPDGNMGNLFLLVS